jgi:hypothetical protein
MESADSTFREEAFMIDLISTPQLVMSPNGIVYSRGGAKSFLLVWGNIDSTRDYRALPCRELKAEWRLIREHLYRKRARREAEKK